MNEIDKVIDVKNLNVSFDTIERRVNVVRGIDFYIEKGEMLGIVGESGCGKSLTALSIMRLVQSPPGNIEGQIIFNERDLLKLSKKEMRKIRGNNISMIFQEPMTSLNPVLTIGQQLIEVLKLHQGLNRSQAREKAIELLKTVNIAMPEQRINEYPHQLSGGMRQRVMISMAMACNPQLLIADEPTTALDVTIQAQILNLMKKLKDDFGTAVMLITHDLGVVAQVCTRALIIYCGEIVESGPVSELFENPLHPYTKGLLNSLPNIGVREKLYVIPGNVPSPSDFPIGCCFSPRCEYAMEKCKKEKPSMVRVGNEHYVRCWLNHSESMEEINE